MHEGSLSRGKNACDCVQLGQRAGKLAFARDAAVTTDRSTTSETDRHSTEVTVDVVNAGNLSQNVLSGNRKTIFCTCRRNDYRERVVVSRAFTS